MTKKKVCQNCGLEKPIAAFIQKSGLLGGIYGSICSTCRSDSESFGKKKTEEGSTTSTTGKRVDAEAKIEGDVSKRAEIAKESEEYYEEREKDAELLTKSTDRTIEKTSTEKKIRNFFEKAPPATENKPVQIDSRSPESIAEREAISDSTEATMDTRAPKRKYQSEFYLQFLQRVKGSPHSKTMETAIDRMEKNKKMLADIPTTEAQVKELVKQIETEKPTSPGTRRR